MTSLLIAATAMLGMVADLAQAAVAMATALLTDPSLLDSMSWGLIAGVLLPILTSVVQQPKWSPRLRTIVGWTMSVVAGVVTCLANGSFDETKTVLATVAVVLVAAQSAYAGWKRTGLTGAVESATSPSQAEHAAE